MYTPSAVIVTVLPSTLTPELAEVSMLLPLRVMVSAALSSYSPERSLSVNISDLLAALYDASVDVCAVTSPADPASATLPHDVSVSISASIRARIETIAFFTMPRSTPASLYVLFLYS